MILQMIHDDTNHTDTYQYYYKLCLVLVFLIYSEDEDVPFKPLVLVVMVSSERAAPKTPSSGGSPSVLDGSWLKTWT